MTGWYPGHMARIPRALRDKLKLVDVVLEAADARAPRASRNPQLPGLVAPRPRLLVLTRLDLADPAYSAAWAERLAGEGEAVYGVNAVGGEGVEAVRRACQAVVGGLLPRSWHRPLRLMVVGVANVGKSSLINRLAGVRSARTGALPGVTRGEQWIRASGPPPMEILDLPGVLPPRLDADTAWVLAALGLVPWGTVPLTEVVEGLWSVLQGRYAESVFRRYGVASEDAMEWEVLEAIARRRGLLGPGGRPDVERAARVLVGDFQEGKLGRINLEFP